MSIASETARLRKRTFAYKNLFTLLKSANTSDLDFFVEKAWNALSPTGVSWIGFYQYIPEKRHLILGPSRDSPACSPIGLHGVCGKGITSQVTQIIDDVQELGDAYVACDPLDRSEIVIPIGNPKPNLILDLDSREKSSFDSSDEMWLKKCLLSCNIEPTDPDHACSG